MPDAGSLSPSGYYAWRGREPSARSKVDEELKARIAAIHKHSRGTYGVPRVHAEFESQGERLGAKRVARLMRALGLEGVSRRPAHAHDRARSRCPPGAGPGGARIQR